MNNIYKKLSVILMFLSMIGCFGFEINNVFADFSADGTVSPVSDGGTSSCGNNPRKMNCYSLGTAGVRISLYKLNSNSNSSTKVGKTIDLWYYSDSLKSFNLKGVPVQFVKKYSKNDVINIYNNLKNGKINSLNDYVSVNDSLTRTSITSILDKSILNDFSNDYSPSTNSYPKGDVYLNSRVSNSTYTIVNRILTQIKEKNYKNLDRILAHITAEKTERLSSENLTDDYYLQFEPLVSWENSLGSNYDTNYSSYDFYGTPMEFTLLSYALSQNKCSKVESEKYGNPGPFNAVGSNRYMFYELATVGVTASNNDFIPKCLGYTAVNAEKVQYEAALASLSNKEAYGVAFIDLSSLTKRGCTDEAAQKIYSRYYNNGSLIAGQKSDSYDNEIIELCKSGSNDYCEHLKSGNLASYGITEVNQVTCNKPQCNTTANRIYNKPVIEIFKFLIKTYVEKFAGFDENTRIKEESDNQYITNFESKKIFGVTSDRDLCNPISCNQIFSNISKTEDNLNKLQQRFGDYDLLNPNILKALYQESENDNSWINKASCKGTPTCPVTPVTASCNGSNNFVLSDTADDTNSSKNDDEKCLKNGIAYNSLKINDEIKNQKTNTQTSFDSEYGTSSNPGYCWESVKFNFPTSVTNITASNTFRWSTNGNTADNNDNLFGTMTVTRKCYLSSEITGSNKSTITSKWAEVNGKRTYTKDDNPNYKDTEWRINPKITIKYEEALPEDVSNEHTILKTSDDLDVNLKKFEMHTYDNNGEELGDYNVVSYDNDGNIIGSDDPRYKDQDPRQFTCGTRIACSRLKYVEMTATYNLTYGDAFKWYSNRSNKDTTISKSEIPNSEQYEEKDGMLGPYRFIGYGLPTSFITPTNLAGTYDYGYDLSTNKGNGKLSAEISQIGTKNKNGKDTYHFDKMVNFAITDDNNSTNDDGKIYYSCGFDINNHIFGNEDEPCEEGTCDMPKGLDVVFRTIDLMDNSTKEELDRAFPGMSGTGRTMGANWSEIYDIEDPNEGAANIFSVLDSSIYNKEPMYHITLDVALIKEIRTLNDKVKGDPYSDKTEVTTDKAKDGEAGYYFGDLNEYGGGIRSLFLSYLYNNGELETSCIKSNKDNGGNERNPDCFKSLVID